MESRAAIRVSVVAEPEVQLGEERGREKAVGKSGKVCWLYGSRWVQGLSGFGVLWRWCGDAAVTRSR